MRRKFLIVLLLWPALAAFIAVVSSCGDSQKEVDENSDADRSVSASPAASGWLADVSARIRNEEYRIQVHGDGFRASNRQQGFRARFGSDGVFIMPWSGWDEWEFPFSVTREGMPSDMPMSIEHSVGNDGLKILHEGREILALKLVEARDVFGADVPAELHFYQHAVRIVFPDFSATYPVSILLGLSATPNWIAESNQYMAEFGFSVSSAGDVNGDGYGDVIVGAYNYFNGQYYDGRAFAFYGSASGLSANWNWFAGSNQERGEFGWSVSSAGDVNGDGYDDVIVGAPGYDHEQTGEGRAYVFHGSASGLSTAPNWIVESNQAYAWFGESVSSAGDVNGDGYDDVLVGAYEYDNGQSSEGRAFVYYGSASGLSTTANWIAESNQAFSFFGYSASSASDVNGDGYDDVIIGAYEYSNGQNYEGRAFVFHGGLDNDACAAAYNLTVPVTLTGNTTQATHNYTPWCVGASTAKDLVYSFEGSAGVDYIVDLLGDASFNTVLYVRYGDCVAGTQIGCNDDYGGVADHSRLDFTASATGTYYVFVDGAGASAGFFTLTITSSTPTTTTTQPPTTTTTSTTTTTTSTTTTTTTTTLPPTTTTTTTTEPPTTTSTSTTTTTDSTTTTSEPTTTSTTTTTQPGDDDTSDDTADDDTDDDADDTVADDTADDATDDTTADDEADDEADDDTTPPDDDASLGRGSNSGSSGCCG